MEEFFFFFLERGEGSDLEWRCAFCYELWEGLFEENGSYSAFIDEVCVRTVEALWLYLV